MKQNQAVTSILDQNQDKPLILIVDDSRVVRISLSNILSQGYQIIEAEDGEQAWKILQETPNIRLVFSDLSMPKLNGSELLGKVRQAENENIRTLPFIVITGEDENSKVHSQLHNKGATELVIKPFDPEIIIEYAKVHAASPMVDSAENSETEQASLNGISSKDTFIQNAKKELSFAIRSKNELALLLLRFDQFEKIKKHYSEPAIEHILITTAEIIRSYTRIEDLVGYFGEGAFAILFPATNSIGTRHLGRKILSDIQAKKFYLGESESTVTASIGISAPDIKPGTTFGNLLNLAEQRLHAAENAGGNRVVDKGNATITPISTLLFDGQETSLTEDERQKQTEISMRKLVQQEVLNQQAEINHGGSKIFDSLETERISDAFYHYENENQLLKEKILELQQQTEDIGKIKHQLHETDALQQQTRLKYQQLQTEFEEMQRRAEHAESSLRKLSESENDRSIIEQHLLQESEILQRKLNTANEQKEKSLHAFKAVETELSNTKLKLRKQKEEFEIDLADERMLRRIAEEKLDTLRKQSAVEKQEKDPFVFTATPSISQIDKAVENGKALSQDHLAIQESPKASQINLPEQRRNKIPLIKHSEKSKKSWPFRILFLTICILSGIVAFKIWDGLSSQTLDTQHNATSMDEKRKSAILETKTRQNHRKVEPEKVRQSTGDNIPLDDPKKFEGAKLQAELELREMAEKEFLLLSN